MLRAARYSLGFLQCSLCVSRTIFPIFQHPIFFLIECFPPPYSLPLLALSSSLQPPSHMFPAETLVSHGLCFHCFGVFIIPPLFSFYIWQRREIILCWSLSLRITSHRRYSPSLSLEQQDCMVLSFPVNILFIQTMCHSFLIQSPSFTLQLVSLASSKPGPVPQQKMRFWCSPHPIPSDSQLCCIWSQQKV